ncbi:MAG: DUF5717 family protein [Lachnospiraceae bacterium]|nr:DUF5717 family protein [Lachnospiraceae bacterium]
MKEVLKRILAEEIDFGEERQPLSFSCTEIVCETVPDVELHGSFRLFSDEEAKGFIYSRDLRMRIEKGEFAGKICEIPYTVDTHGLPHGAECSGILAVVSDHGEYELPYRIIVSGQLPDSSLGEIRNLFHFANLAKADWEEASELFYSPRFLPVLNGTDAMYLGAYRGFRTMSGNSQNLEIFLEESRKKTRPSYQCEVERVDMMLPRKTMRRHMKIVRDGWGYAELHLSAEGDFLQVEQEVLHESDFPGNVAEFSYIIDRDALVPGENRGELIIRDRLDEKRIPVVVNAPVKEVEDGERSRLSCLMRLYLNYRVGRISQADFIAQGEHLVDEVLQKTPEDLEYRLYQAQLLLVQKRPEEARTILDRVAVLADEQGVPAEHEAYRLYLQSLCTEDADFRKSLSDHVAELFRDREGSWRLAWISMSMDPSFEGNERKKWKLLREQVEQWHNSSPILFLEAYHIIIQAPKRLDTLGEFEITLLRFALRYGLMTRELKERFAMLSMEEHSYSEELCSMLKDCYEPEQSVVLLEAICLQLIRGNRTGTDAFAWYSRAVEKELRLSRLYENYICSAPLDHKGGLPRIVLMYFAYRSPLDAERNAFLYSNVLRHKNEYQEVYEQYLPVITEFVREQIGKGRLDENLAFLYKKILSGKKQEQPYADAYTELLFVEKVRVSSDKLSKIVVVYEHLQREKVYALENREAMIPLYGERFSLLAEDEWGNRYSDEGLFERKRMLRDKPDSRRVLAMEDPSVGAMLCVAEQSGDAPSVSEENRRILEFLADRSEISEDYRLRIKIALAEYYFDGDDIAPLDRLMLEFEPLLMDNADRERCIHIMVARGLYEEAFSWVRSCGNEGIDSKILVRLCDRLMARNDMEYNEDMLKLCRQILVQGRYDEDILNYLLRYDRGTLKERKDLWRAADSFGLDVQDLLESMMTQVLFTASDIPEKIALYLDHLGGGIGTELERAYLARLCYDHFILQRETDEKVFVRVGQLIRLGESLQTVCILSWLKNASERFAQAAPDEADRELCLDFLEMMHRQGIFFAFFTAFADLDPRCRLLAGHSFIEYRGREGSRVILHYVWGQDEPGYQDYYREEMQHVFGGIFVKEFPLFYGERIHYYITEEDGRSEKLTRSSLLEYEDDGSGQTGEDRFAVVNNMAIACELNDELTFMKLLKDYENEAYTVERLFLPVESRKRRREEG